MGCGSLTAVRCMAQRPALKETGSQAVYCKHTAPGSPNRPTRTITRGACAMGRRDLDSAMTTDCQLLTICHTGLYFYGHP